jgi:hypothetical protein
MEKIVTDIAEMVVFTLLIVGVVTIAFMKTFFALWLRRIERDKERLTNDFSKDYWNVDSYLNSIKEFKFYHLKYRSLIGEFKTGSGKEKKDRVQDLIAPVIGI